MTWSLEMRHGDFTLTGARYGTVTNEVKLVQDLRCALLEKMGTDNLHPEFGSLIDGGVKPDGTEIPGVIGETQVDLVVLAVESEIRRIAKDYQAQQLARAKGDQSTFNRSTLTPAEVLFSVAGLDIKQDKDTLHVTVRLLNGRQQPLEIQVPIPNAGGTPFSSN